MISLFDLRVLILVCYSPRQSGHQGHPVNSIVRHDCEAQLWSSAFRFAARKGARDEMIQG